MRIISAQELLAERRKYSGEIAVPYIGVDGKEKSVKKKIANGEMEVYELAKPIGEMIVTPANLDQLIQNTVINLELGREAVPLLYKPIYRTIDDANFSEHVDITPFAGCRVVFLEHMEGGEVKFGTYKVGTKGTAPIVTYSAGFEYTEDMVVYNKTWSKSEIDRAFGEAYNALLNHIHLNPILAFGYAAKNQTAAAAGDGKSRIELLRTTVRNGLKHAAQDKNADTGAVRKPTVLLAHSSNRWDIEECLQRLQIGGTILPAISQIDTLIFYDGWTVTVGEKTHTYSGCATDKAYLIEPTKRFRELVKHDLKVDATGADLSRLIEDQVVGRARRGVVTAIAESVEEITLPA
jgi:hypothetical protein